MGSALVRALTFIVMVTGSGAVMPVSSGPMVMGRCPVPVVPQRHAKVRPHRGDPLDRDRKREG